MGTYQYIILITILVIASQIYNIISEKYKIPSVIFLIITGYGLKRVVSNSGYNFEISPEILQVLGTVGLVMIVLEGSLDLKLEKSKIDILNKSLLVTMFLLFFSIIIIAAVIKFFTGAELINSLLHAIPLSIISSAIVIPSVGNLEESKKEFMIYESTFSDIIGILLFNYFAYTEMHSLIGIRNFIFSMLVMVFVSIIATFILIFILGKNREETKTVTILSVILLLYSIAKIYHFSALILVLIFGIIVNNFEEILNFFKLKEKLQKIISTRKTLLALRQAKIVNGELSFFIRTIFFITFGYSIELLKIFESKIIIVGTVIVLMIYTIRYINLKMIVKTEIFPEIMIAPRGLITVLLFYSIPIKYQIDKFDEGLLFFVIISTSIIMMAGLIVYKKPFKILKDGEF